jgi:hypothetical protein
VLLDPVDVTIHPVLQELPAALDRHVPVAVKNPSFTWMYASGWPSVGMSRYARMLRRCCCAIDVPGAPPDAPITPAGLPDQAL